MSLYINSFDCHWVFKKCNEMWCNIVFNSDILITTPCAAKNIWRSAEPMFLYPLDFYRSSYATDQSSLYIQYQAISLFLNFSLHSIKIPLQSKGNWKQSSKQTKPCHWIEKEGRAQIILKWYNRNDKILTRFNETPLCCTIIRN